VQKPRSARLIFGLITDYSLHVFTAVVGSMTVGAVMAVLLFVIWSAASPQHSHLRFVQARLVQRPFLFQLLSAILLGWLAAPRLRAVHLAKWAWVVPSAALLVHVIAWKANAGLSGESVCSHFFGQCPRLYCEDQFSVTLPFFASVVYSIAASLKPSHVFKSPSTNGKSP
jgi:hypothetical protein